jgi:hypothetical protein
MSSRILPAFVLTVSTLIAVVVVARRRARGSDGRVAERMIGHTML